ncbi:MAG: hypothetical protein RSP_14890 [Rhodanobacter sp.]
MKKLVQYAIHNSPLYKLSSRKRMLTILKMTAEESAFIRRKRVYNHFETEDKYKSELPALKHKARQIQSPETVLKRVQTRLANLLGRIELPDYLHSARKGCSYKSNARAHAFGHSVARIDIKKFYERVHVSYIQKYFLDDLKCSRDIAHRLTELVSYDRRLPTGSPASPIMSFLAYRSMFDELHVLATSMGLTMTVYVDDVVVSGPGLSSHFIQPAQAIIGRYGLCAHKFSTTCAGLPTVITGLQQTANGESAPPTRFRKLRALETELRRTTDLKHKAVLLKGLIGQYREGMELIPNALSHANRYQREFDRLPDEVRLKASRRRRRGSQPRRLNRVQSRISHRP